MTVEGISFEYIHEHWDSPIEAPWDDGMNDCYCIGGAFCQATGLSTEAFPSKSTLLDALKSYNPKLPHKMAVSFASQIINLNDQGNFVDAWADLEDAMLYYE